DQIVQHPPGQEALDDLPVVGGGDHDDGGVLSHGVEAVYKLHPVHGGGVVVQNDQIRAAVLQHAQSLSAALENMGHLKAGVRLHILPVDGGHHGVVLNDDHLICHSYASSGTESVKVRVKQVPAPASVITSMVPWCCSTSWWMRHSPNPRPSPLEETPFSKIWGWISGSTPPTVSSQTITLQSGRQ